jgi:hypothetical protein
LSDHGDGLYVAKEPDAKRGWAAYFIEMTFPRAGLYGYKFTTGVWVVRDRFPFGPPSKEEEAALRSGSPSDR